MMWKYNIVIQSQTTPQIFSPQPPDNAAPRRLSDGDSQEASPTASVVPKTSTVQKKRQKKSKLPESWRKPPVRRPFQRHYPTHTDEEHPDLTVYITGAPKRKVMFYDPLPPIPSSSEPKEEVKIPDITGLGPVEALAALGHKLKEPLVKLGPIKPRKSSPVASPDTKPCEQKPVRRLVYTPLPPIQRKFRSSEAGSTKVSPEPADN